MQFVRKIIDSRELENIVEMPVELKNRKVEMLLFPIEPEKPEPRKSFDPRAFRGVVKIDEQVLKKQVRELREEWQRFD